MTTVQLSMDGAEQVRQTLSRFATGVVVVTARHGGDVGGMTANAFLSMSMDPPLVGVCLAATSRTHALVKRSGAYAVSVLRSDHADLARAFARPSEEKAGLFASLAWDEHVTGAPALRDALAVLDCRVVAQLPVADHTLFVGSPLAVAVDGEGLPLLFYARAFATIGRAGEP